MLSGWKIRRRQNRLARLKQLATRRGMAKAAAVQARRRGSGTDHLYVVGQFFLEEGRVLLRAVECGPAFDIPRPPRFTPDASRFNRWRTRQAADQFKTRWKLDAHVLNLHFLDVLSVERGT